MNPKQLKKLKKQVKKAHQVVKKQPYIEQLMTYRDLFDDFPQIKFLINNVLESDRLIKNGLLPQPLPKLLLPDNIQDIIFKKVNEQYLQGNPEGDRLWNRYVDALPKLDRLLRNYRDYLEATYGMWSYVNAPYIKALSEYLHGRPTLEIMAGNGYISSGLRNLRPAQTIEPLDALAAIKKYGSQVDYVIMSWSPDKLEIDWEVLQLLRKDYPEVKLLVIGEKNGATDSAKFWQNAHLTQDDELKKVIDIISG